HDPLERKNGFDRGLSRVDALRNLVDEGENTIEGAVIDDQIGIDCLAPDIDQDRHRSARQLFADQTPDIGIETIETRGEPPPDIETASVDGLDLDQNGNVAVLGAGASEPGHAGNRLLAHAHSPSAAGSSAASGAVTSPACAASSAAMASISARASASAAASAARRSISR